MQFLDRQPARLALLALVVSLLGMAILATDSERKGAATGSPLAAQQSTANTTRRAMTEPAPGALVAVKPSEATVVPAPAAATEAPTAPVEPAPVVAVVERRGGIACAAPHQVVQVPTDLAIHSTPGGRAVATMPARSRYLDQSTVAWVQATTPDGLWGRVTLPWTKPVGRAGWIPLTGLSRGSTRTMVVADLSERRVHAYRGCEELLTVPSAIGRSGSPSPTGRYWVTDRIAVPAAQQGSFGTFAFGLSTVQPNLPAGWTGGDQMAIHGTGAPGSIGQAASAGCLRVDEAALAQLRPLLLVGTPVIIQA